MLCSSSQVHRGQQGRATQLVQREKSPRQELGAGWVVFAMEITNTVGFYMHLKAPLFTFMGYSVRN